MVDAAAESERTLLMRLVSIVLGESVHGDVAWRHHDAFLHRK